MTAVDDETIKCTYSYDGTLDEVPIGSPDLICEPRAPDEQPEPSDFATVEPPQSWREANTTPEAGARCRVQLFGEWHAAVVTEVTGDDICFRYVKDETVDAVPLGSPDLVCEPRPPSNPNRGVQRPGRRPAFNRRPLEPI